ncbi:peptidylprolyl isomerase [Synechococcus sp. CBW1107]|uniref:peptidylprolyl isomerase n=1 Tax=Synechococcus sp. CBW1107 TaxID=2789857 RepID=UPI002AD30EB7|nr:peptidylprolyl isomerase [Synechococcus sp. CBW1107]
MVIAAAVAAVEITAEEREKLMAAYRHQFKLQDEPALAAFLSQRSIELNDLIWQMELPLRIQRHVREHFMAKAEARFLERKNQLDSVVYSLIRVKDPFLARELYLQIADGEASFGELAATYAEGREKDSHGIIGPKTLSQAHPTLAEKLLHAEPGKVLEPFPVEDWWLIARVERYDPARFDEAMADRMATELFEQWVGEEVARRINGLSAAAGAAEAPPT